MNGHQYTKRVAPEDLGCIFDVRVSSSTVVPASPTSSRCHQVKQWKTGHHPIRRFFAYLEHKGWWDAAQDRQLRDKERLSVLNVRLHYILFALLFGGGGCVSASRFDIRRYLARTRPVGCHECGIRLQYSGALVHRDVPQQEVALD